MNSELIKKILEGALLAAGKSLTVVQLEALFEDEQRPPRDQLKAALEDIEADCRDRGFELKQTASGYRFQVCQELSPWVNKLWEEKPKRYSRALLETLSLIAYRQPLTRGDIELVRGVAVSSDIIRSLMEREWIRVVGHRDVPGKPALYATTKQFLDYFNLKSLEHLPALSELKDLTELDPELEMTLAAGVSSEPGMADDQPSGVDAAVDTELAVEPQIDGVDQQDSPAEPESLNSSSTTDE